MNISGKSKQAWRIGILVVSDTRADDARRGKDTDISGKIIERELRDTGYETVREIVPNDPRVIRRSLLRLIKDPRTAGVLITGGTGISDRDVTVDTVERMYSKRIPGIGEALRRLGQEKVGFPALLSRTSAGLVDRKPVFCLPGTPDAVRMALRLILPNLDLILCEATR
jgi:molybdenum cofactor biosynthesis protein B